MIHALGPDEVLILRARERMTREALEFASQQLRALEDGDRRYVLVTEEFEVVIVKRDRVETEAG